MRPIADWLNALGLGQYAERFAANDIDVGVLRDLTEADLEKIGVSLGHRKIMLRAIGELDDVAGATEPVRRNEAERRQLTVMFADLIGSTAMSTRLDPEDLRNVIAACHRCCAEQIAKWGGFIARYMGDGVLAYFGYPHAHEDDAERAVRGGLALLAEIAKLSDDAGGALRMRIGIATGLVVVGDLIGEAAAREFNVVGETPNLAARLQGLAEPDTIVVDATTRRLLADLFEQKDLGAMQVKGFASPVRAYQVIRPSAVESRFEAMRAIRTPLVGREDEVHLLMRRWEQAKGGEGSIVLISGEPGIGKSRLAQTVAERLSGEPYSALRLFCSPYHGNSALYPMITEFERAAGFRRDDTDQQRLNKLEATLAQAFDELGEAAPLISNLLGVPAGDRYPPLDLTPQKRKEKTLQALLGQLEGLAKRQPVLMVFEDVHWIDPTSQDLLDLLVDRVPALPVLLIITYRTEFAPPWIGRPQVMLLSLSRLTPKQCVLMITHLTGDKPLPKEVAGPIADRTDGVPLFVEELIKTVIESGVLADAGDRYTLDRPLAPLAIPTTLQGSLLARLDRLAPAREMAQIGAALGRHFSYELISAVALKSQQELDSTLAQLVGAELISRRGTPPDAEYVFKHALVQDAAYSTLLHTRRQEIHARIATTLERQFPEIVATQPEVMARHFAEAGLNEKAVGYRLKAGQRAVARSAMTEAVAQLQSGLGLLANLPESACRTQQELDLQIALARALIPIKGYSSPLVGEAVLRARTLAEQLDRPEHLVPLLYSQWIFHTVRAEHKVALALAEHGEAQNDEATQLLGRNLRGNSCLYLGEFVAARALLEQCEGLRDPAHRAVYIAQTAEDQYAVNRARLAMTLAFLGYLDQSRARIDEAISEARRLDHAYTVAWVFGRIAGVEWVAGLPHDVERHARQVVALSKEHGFAYWLSMGLLLHGWSLTVLGQPQGGLALIADGLAQLRDTGAIQATPLGLGFLAEANGHIGQLEQGLSLVAEAARIIESTDERYTEADLYRIRGDLLTATGDRAAAEQSYHQSLAVAKQQHAKGFELRAAVRLARLSKERGKRAEAADLVAPIYRWFTEGLETPNLKSARALLDGLTG
jgi:predicted ATPase/class 3 adenylate cyclase